MKLLKGKPDPDSELKYFGKVLPPLITYSLVDSKVSDDEKASLAAAILAIPRPKEFPPQNVIEK